MTAKVWDRLDDAAPVHVASAVRRALADERAGRYREAWDAWERLRGEHPGRPDWNAPLAASYLRYALAWTADCGEGSLGEAEAALVRCVTILTDDIQGGVEDVARLMMIARACEQRCVLKAFGAGWTSAARDALDLGEAPAVVGDLQRVAAAGAAATAALDLVALAAPSLGSLASDLAQSCLRLSATLRAAGEDEAADGLEMRAATVLRGPAPRPALVAKQGGAGDAAPRRGHLRLVTTPTA